MTLNIIEPEIQINGIENSERIVSPRNLDTEEKRIEFLQDMLDTMKKTSGSFNGPPGFIDILSQSLCDSLPASRCLALDILCGLIPGYLGNHLDILFPQLLQNLLHHHTSVKKATLQVLHMYFKYSQDKSVILDFLVKYGIKSEKKSLRNEVLLAMPALIRSGFTQKQLENVFISILAAAFAIDNGESSLPIVLCLEHIKDEMGDENFLIYFNSLDKSLCNLYKKIVKHCLSYHESARKFNSSKTNETSHSQSSPNVVAESSRNNENDVADSVTSTTKENIVFGFVPKWIITKLDKNNNVSWQERSDVINEFLALVSTHVNDEVMKGSCGELLKYICSLIEDHNYNVALTSLTILHKVIVKVGPAIRYHMEMILKALVKKLNDPKPVVKKINLRIALSLMHSVSPTIYIQNILPLLKHKSARVREEVINMITAALLSFPSSYFDLTVMASQFSFALLDSKRKVRHACLECLAILAQKLGSGKLSPLVSAVDKIETEEGGKGVLAAVQARLGRRILPRINDEGCVQYALVIPTGILQMDTVALDIAWVVVGTSGGSDSSRHGREVPEKRYFSAGKKKLPWQSEDVCVEGTRKVIGSAPSRQGLPPDDGPHDATVPVVRDTWVTDSLLANKQTKAFQKNKFPLHSKTSPISSAKSNVDVDSPTFQKDFSYFEIYKNKMRELKAAGLQADARMIKDAHMINSLNPRERHSLTSDIDQKYMKDILLNKKSLVQPMNDRSSSNDILSPLSMADPSNATSPASLERTSPTTTATEQEHPQYTPIPIKATIARSASKKRIKVHMDEKKQESPPSSSNQISNEVEQTPHSQLKSKQDKQRNTRIDRHSPFPLRATIHRSPSGRMNSKPLVANDTTADSNLKDMAEYSFSSPNLSRQDVNADERTTTNDQNTPPPTVMTPPPHIKDVPLGKIINTSLNLNFRNKNTEPVLKDNIVDYDDNPDAPKLAKSAQEKLRKLKEERLRHSIDSSGLKKNKKESRLSRSLDFKSIGLIDNPDNRYTQADIFQAGGLPPDNYLGRTNELPEKYLGKNKKNDRTVKGKHSKTKREKRHKDFMVDEHEKPYKDSAIDDLYDSMDISSNTTSTKQKDYDKQEHRNNSTDTERNFLKHKELRNYNERLHLDLSLKLDDSSEASVSPNATFGNTTFDNSTPGGNSTPQGNVTFDNSNSTPAGNSTPRNSSPSTPRSREAMLEIKGASVFDSSSGGQLEIQDNLINTNENNKFSRKTEKKKKSRKAKMDDSSNDINNDEMAVGRGKRSNKSSPEKYPIAASSPMIRRRNISSVDSNNNHMEVGGSQNSFNHDLDKELPNPQHALSTVLDLLRSDEWESKCDGLFTIRRLTLFHSEYLHQDFHLLVEAVLTEVKNLRSQVTRAALGVIADFFACVPKLIEPELDFVLKTVLLKASDTNQFIRIDVEEALKKLVENVQSQKAMAAIISTGVNHRSALVRKVFAKYLADLSEKAGSPHLKGMHKDIIPVAAKLSVDPQPDARYHGRRMLLLLLGDPDFDKQLQKDVPSSNLRPVQDVVENLRNKGLGEPPAESAKRSSRNGFIPYSNRASEVMKTTRGSEVIKGAPEVIRTTSQSMMKDTNAENGSSHSKREYFDLETPEKRTPEKHKRKASNKESQFTQPLNLECLQKLDSSSWSERYEGLDDVYDLICMKPNESSSNVIKIFDKVCPRLNDSNSKVNLYALQTLNRCIPILRNGMSTATTLVIENLKSSLASKNEGIYAAAKDSLNTLVKYVDNVYLLQPLCTMVQFSNVRNKPEFAECLADIISPVYARKPTLVHRLVLPLLWNFLSTANSGVNQSGRANLQHAMGRICKILYQCLGKELLIEAENKGVRASQKLEILLQ